MRPGSVVLIVEDNPDDEVFILRALKSVQGMPRIIVARDGAEAQELLLGASSMDLPRFVIMDLKLPKITGMELVRRLREDSRTRLLPVVIFTSSKEEDDVSSCLQAGANSYVGKPVDFDELQATVKKLGEYWLSINESAAWERRGR